MRFYAAILFTVLYLISFTEFHEVFRLPYLFEHYREHLQTDHTGGVLAFLLTHYCDVSQQAQHDHHDLPFSPGHCTQPGSTSPVSIPELFETEFRLYSQARSHACEESPTFMYTEYHLSIWQPPRA